MIRPSAIPIESMALKLSTIQKKLLNFLRIPYDHDMVIVTENIVV